MKDDKHLAHADLTRTIIGAAFDMYKELGFGLQEKNYQRALAIRFDNLHVPYRREQSMPVQSLGKIIGRYFMDFLVDDAVVVELKVANDFYESHIKQIVAYLKLSRLSVGLLVIITPERVKVRRIGYTEKFPRNSS